MTGDRWRKLNELFHMALELDPAALDDFIHRSTTADPEMQSELRRMLEAHRQSGFLDRAPVSAAAPVFADNQLVAGRYRILRFVGRGGMGEVYEAYDAELHDRVALKTLLPAIAGDPRMIARFKHEIQLARKIAHPAICRVFDLSRDPLDTSTSGSTYFLTMEFLEGETLGAKLDRDGPLPSASALAILDQVAGGLDAAHTAGVLHRDLKPSNIILISREAQPSPGPWPLAPGPRLPSPGPQLRAVVTDFGLARRILRPDESTATLSGVVMGTPDFMAPELFAGRPASIASDVYALGIIARQLVAAPDPLWSRAIARATDPHPARRWPTAGAFVAALRGQTASVTLKLPVMTRRRWIAASSSAALCIAAIFGWYAWESARNRPSPQAAAYYQKGVEDIQVGASFAAAKALGEAVNLAPNFSLAHARLAEAWAARSLPERAEEEMLRARRQDLSHLSTLDRLQIEAIDLEVTREFAAAAAKLESMRGLSGADPGVLAFDLARAYELAGNRPKALENYRRAAEGPSRNPSAWLRLAVIYNQAADFAQSDQAFAEAERLYQLTSNLEGLTSIMIERGIAAGRRGRREEAATYLHKATDTARLSGDTYKEIEAQLQLSASLSDAGDPTTAEQYARQSLDSAQSNGIEDEVVRALLALGQAHAMQRDFSAAEREYQSALVSAERDRSHLLAARSHFTLAALYDQMKRPQDAAREARQALAYYQPNRFVQDTINCLLLIARSERSSGAYQQAQATFQSLADMAQKSADRQRLAQAYEGLGTVSLAQEQFPQALDYFQKDLESSPLPRLAANARQWCGYVLALLGRDHEAAAMWDAADPEAQNIPTLRLWLELRRAALALTMARYPEALKLARGVLTGPIQQDAIASATARELLGLAELRAGKKSDGRRDCEQALAGLSGASDAAALLQAQMAALEARIETADSAAAQELFHQIEPTLAAHPESRWRALALISRIDRTQSPAAAESLAALQQPWGADAYKLYLHRPDIQRLARPLLQPISAKSN